MGIIKGKTIDTFPKPFSSDKNYKGFLESIDTVLPQIETVQISAMCDHGVVSGTGDFSKNTKFTLTCTPSEGYRFQYWATKDSSQQYTLVSRSRSLTLSATHSECYYAMVSTGASYEVKSACICGNVSGSGVYPSGSTCILTCTPSNGYVFSQWSDVKIYEGKSVLSTGLVEDDPYCYCTDFISVAPGTSLTWHWDSTTASEFGYLCEYDASKRKLNSWSIWGSGERVVVTSANARYVRATFLKEYSASSFLHDNTKGKRLVCARTLSSDDTYILSFPVSQNTFYRATCIPYAATDIKFTVIGQVDPSNAGSVIVPNDGIFKAGTTCSGLEFVDGGTGWFTFTRWNDGDTANPHTPFKVNKNITLTAQGTDSRKKCIVGQSTDAGQEHGHLEGNFGPNYSQVISPKYREGEFIGYGFDDRTLSVTAVPDAGYRLASFQYQVVYNSGPLPQAVAITGNTYNYGLYTIASGDVGKWPVTIYFKATFELITYVVRTSANPNNTASFSLTVDGVHKSLPYTHTPGTGTGVCVLTATIASGSTFDHWERNGVVITQEEPSMTITFNANELTSDVTYTVFCQVRKEVLTYSQPSSGALVTCTDAYGNSIPSGTALNIGTVVYFRYTLEPHYQFYSWLRGEEEPEYRAEDVFDEEFNCVILDTGASWMGDVANKISLNVLLDPSSAPIFYTKLPSNVITDISAYPPGMWIESEISGGAYYYFAGDTATFTANLNPGYEVTKWEWGSAKQESESYVFDKWNQFSTTNPSSLFTFPEFSNVSDDVWHIRVTADLKTCVFNCSSDAEGVNFTAYVNGSEVSIPYTGHYNDEVTVRVTYDTTKYSGITWSDGSTETSRTFKLEFSQYAYIVTPISRNTFRVTLNAENCHDLTGADVYGVGNSVIVTAVPDDGYTFKGWKKNDVFVSDSTTYIFTMPSQNVYLTAVAELTGTHTVSVSASPLAGGTVSGGGTVSSGGSTTISATPNANYSFTGWYEGEERISTESSYTVTNITEDRTFVARFSTGTCKVTIAPSTGLYYIPSVGEYTWNIGESYEIIAVPNPASDYVFDHWQDGYAYNTYTLIPTADTTITAYAVKSSKKVTFSATGGTIQAVAGETVIQSGDSVQWNETVVFTATPSPGKVLTASSWSVSIGYMLSEDYTTCTISSMPKSPVTVKVTMESAPVFTKLYSYYYYDKTFTSTEETTSLLWSTDEWIEMPIYKSSIGIFVETTNNYTVTASTTGSGMSVTKVNNNFFILSHTYSRNVGTGNSVTFTANGDTRTYRVRFHTHHLWGYVRDNTEASPTGNNEYLGIKGASVVNVAATAGSGTYRFYTNPQTTDTTSFVPYRWGQANNVGFALDAKSAQVYNFNGELVQAKDTIGTDFVDTFNGVDLYGVSFNTSGFVTDVAVTHPNNDPDIYEVMVTWSANSSGSPRFFLLASQTASFTAPILLYQSA